MCIRTHYDRLGIATDADSTRIREAYRRLAREHHPDARGGRPSPEMPAINEAYRVLSDPARRSDYDRMLRAGTSSATPSSATPSTGSSASRPARHVDLRNDPPRFPWRFVVSFVVLGALAVLVVGALTDAGPAPAVDNVLRAGDCAVLDTATRTASEAACDGPHDAVVESLVPFDGRCAAGLEPFRDRQGMGVACIRRVGAA